MPRILSILLGLVLCSSMSCTISVQAKPPDIRFPEWYKSSVIVNNYNPLTHELRIAFKVEAILGPIHDLSAEVVWPKGFIAESKKCSLAYLAAGQTWVAEFVAKAPSSYDGWFDIAAFARPDRQALQAYIEKPGIYQSTSKAVLLAELADLNKPLPIGLTSPLTVGPQLTVALPSAFLPMPIWPVNGKNLHLWAPAVTFANSAVQMRFAEWQAAILSRDATSVRQAGTALIAAISSEESQQIELTGANQYPITLNSAMLRKLVQMSVDAILNLQAHKNVLVDQLKSLGKEKPSFTDGFRAANLGVVLAERGLKTEAEKAWMFALDQFPAWNLVREWTESIGRK